MAEDILKVRLEVVEGSGGSGGGGGGGGSPTSRSKRGPLGPRSTLADELEGTQKRQEARDKKDRAERMRRRRQATARPAAVLAARAGILGTAAGRLASTPGMARLYPGMAGMAARAAGPLAILAGGAQIALGQPGAELTAIGAGQAGVRFDPGSAARTQSDAQGQWLTDAIADIKKEITQWSDAMSMFGALIGATGLPRQMRAAVRLGGRPQGDDDNTALRVGKVNVLHEREKMLGAIARRQALVVNAMWRKVNGGG